MKVKRRLLGQRHQKEREGMRKENWDEYHQKTNNWITGERVVYVCPISSLTYNKHV